jgi:hypothetical protein
VQIDLKVCNTKSKRGNKYIVGIIDMKTTRSWAMPSPSNSAADLIRIFTPPPSNSAADLIHIFAHWKVQTIGNKPVGMIMTDNESWACSEGWTNAMDNMQIPQRKAVRRVRASPKRRSRKFVQARKSTVRLVPRII